MPATASIVADKIGATKAGAFDVQAGCTGFVYGLAIATAFVSANIYKNVLVVGAEVLSKMVDWEDRSTCVLFGDGAGAVLVQPTDNGSIFSFDLGNDGSGAPYLLVPAGGSRMPATHETVRDHEHAMHMTGSEVFKFATRTVAELVQEGPRRRRAHRRGRRPVRAAPGQHPHHRVRRAAPRHSPRAQVFANLDRYGNTSCASIPHLPARGQPERPPQEGRHAAAWPVSAPGSPGAPASPSGSCERRRSGGSSAVHGHCG